MNENSSSPFFRNRQEWRSWLELNHETSNELWLIYYKKHTGRDSIVYREALEEALCFGWIDGLVKRIDEDTYMQRFTPRRNRSNWSATNIRLALKLLAEGKMHESGLKYKDHWITERYATSNQASDILSSPELEAALLEYPDAALNFKQLSASFKKQYVMWIMAAKREETRLNRISEAISLLEKGKKLGLK